MENVELDIDLRKPVVIVDDDDVVLKHLSVILTKIGFTDIREAANGQKALVTMLNTNSELLITDVDMPIMDGIQLVKQLRKNPRFNALPILALTANDTKEMVLKTLKAGVDSYLIKGKIQEQEVMVKVKEAIDLRKQKLKKKAVKRKMF